MSDPDQAPKETAEFLSFLCAFGKVAMEAYSDDKRITLLETIGMVGLLREAVAAMRGVEVIGKELDELTPEQARKLADIPAHFFHRMVPTQHEHIALAALACIPTITNFLQTIRQSAAMAAEFPGQNAPRANPA
jgi:hypothetical protein